MMARPMRVRPRRGLGKAGIKLVSLAVVSVFALGACASDPSASGDSQGSGSEAVEIDVSDEAVSDVIRRAFLQDIPLDELDPAIQQTMRVAAQEWTPEMDAKLQECLGQNVCETGREGLTVAFPNDNINP